MMETQVPRNTYGHNLGMACVDTQSPEVALSFVLHVTPISQHQYSIGSNASGSPMSQAESKPNQN